jgi:CubicO group peptidase (beta-lactamase class C family)
LLVDDGRLAFDDPVEKFIPEFRARWVLSEANRHFSPGTFGHGGAFGTQSWADPRTGLIYVFMIQRDKIPGNPDNSPMRRAYQDVVATVLRR